MRFFVFLLALAAFSVPAFAQQDGGVTVWQKGVPPEGIKQKADFGDHILSISRRDKDGRCEVHKTKADVMVIQSGAATLITGGEVIDPVVTGPNELQGSGIRGGVKRTVGPGDVIEIPVGVPHQFLLAPRTQITYFLVKVVKH
jgi:mannose-6-phosphate isomerase-like protein (cupin superfamily)